MSLTKDDLNLIQQMLDTQKELFDEKLDRQRSMMMTDMRSLVRQELESIHDQIEKLKRTEDGDIRAMYGSFEKLRKDFKKLEARFVKFEKAASR